MPVVNKLGREQAGLLQDDQPAHQADLFFLQLVIHGARLCDR
jgi:hypothetical protein